MKNLRQSIHGPLVLGTLVFVTSAANLRAADLRLSAETVAAWNEYLETAKCSMKDRVKPGAHFLWLDEDPQRAARARNGEIVAAPVNKDDNPHQVPSGLIHHWIAAAFVPNSTIKDVFAVVNDYQHYKDIYKPSVIDSKALSRHDMEGRFKLLLQSKSHFVKTAFDGDYASTDVQVNPTNWYSFSHTTNLQEIQHYGQAKQTKLPAGQGSGVIWGLFSINRFAERDGGVYVEVEAIGLSREIPNGLHWLVDPIVRRVAKSSLVTTLEQTSGAVRTQVAKNGSKSEAPVATAEPASSARGASKRTQN